VLYRRGGIVFDNVHMSYRSDFDPVLKGVSLAINPGERIGIVGRTGSGKSSLFRALLRLTEMENNGDIYIDGVNIKSISMSTLRMAVSIIPQDPVLFSGTLRSINA
jgi:ABC-type multidrug transport system fused ATPase/permease subunit